MKFPHCEMHSVNIAECSWWYYFSTRYLCLYDLFKNDFTEDGIDQIKARKLIAQKLPFSRNTINNVLREKRLFGNVLGGAAPKSRLRRFDKLSAEQKEDIRKLVGFICIIVVAWNGFQIGNVTFTHNYIKKFA